MRSLIVMVLLLPTLARAADDVAALKQRVAELEAEVARLQTDTIDLAKFNELGLSVYGGKHALFDGQGHLSADYVALLLMTPEQARAVDDAFTAAQTGIAAIIAKQKPQVERDGDGIVLTLADFSAQAQPVRDQLAERLRQSLGEQRQRFVTTAFGTTYSDRFLDFGHGALTLKLHHAKMALMDGLQFSLEHKILGGLGGSSSIGGMDAQLPPTCALLKPYLPKELGGDAAGPAPAESKDDAGF